MARVSNYIDDYELCKASKMTVLRPAVRRSNTIWFRGSAVSSFTTIAVRLSNVIDALVMLQWRGQAKMDLDCVKVINSGVWRQGWGLETAALKNVVVCVKLFLSQKTLREMRIKIHRQVNVHYSSYLKLLQLYTQHGVVHCHFSTPSCTYENLRFPWLSSSPHSVTGLRRITSQTSKEVNIASRYRGSRR